MLAINITGLYSLAEPYPSRRAACGLSGGASFEATLTSIKEKVVKRVREYLLFLLLFALVAGGMSTAKDGKGDPRAALTDEGAEYLGATQCMMCHSDYKEGYLKTKHALTLGNTELPQSVVGCEMCHGPGSQHMSNFTNDPGERMIVNFQAKGGADFAAVCLDCHRTTMTRTDFKENAHANAKVYCASCHDPHDNKTGIKMLAAKPNDLCASCHSGVAARFKSGLSAHPVKKGDFLCVDCHNPHSAADNLLANDGVSKTCGECHEFARQPYIFSHVSEFTDPTGQACLNCHTHHSSSVPNQLRSPGRSLCLSCHSDLAGHNAGITCWTSGCHTHIHGSNNSPVFLN